MCDRIAERPEKKKRPHLWLHLWLSSRGRLFIRSAAEMAKTRGFFFLACFAYISHRRRRLLAERGGGRCETMTMAELGGRGGGVIFSFLHPFIHPTQLVAFFSSLQYNASSFTDRRNTAASGKGKAKSRNKENTHLDRDRGKA